MSQRYFFILLVVMLTLSAASCSEKYENRDPATLNRRLQNNTSVKTPRDIVLAYDSLFVQAAAQGDLTTSVEHKTGETLEVTAKVDIHDDDEVGSEKYIFLVQHFKNGWHVFAIRYSFEYREGRP